jgi:hypothetical protein
MPQATFRDWLSDTLPDLRAVLGKEMPAAVRLRVDSHATCHAYGEAIDAGKWPKLAQLGQAELQGRGRDLAKLAVAHDRVASLAARCDALAAFAAHPTVDITARSDWPVIRRSVSSELSGQMTPAEVQRAISAFTALDEKAFAEELSAVLAAIVARLDSLACAQLKARAGARLALAVAALNTPIGAVVRAASLVTFCDKTQNTLREGRAKLWMAFKDGNADEIRSAAVNSAQTAEVALTSGDAPAKLAQACVLWAAARSDRAKGGELALRLSTLLDSLLRSTVLGEYLAWIGTWHVQHPRRSEWVARAKKLKLESGRTAPPVKTPRELLANAGKWDGKTVRVDGALGPISTTDIGRRAVAVTSLTADGASIAVISADPLTGRRGARAGAYSSPTGTWAKHVEELRAPALLVDPDTVDERAWTGWATTELRPLYRGIGGGEQVQWSVQAGKYGVAVLLRTGEWATPTAPSSNG